MLSLMEFDGGEEHFFLDILEFSVTEIIEDEMISEAAENEVGVGVIFLLDGDFDILLDTILDLSQMLVFELVVVIDEMMGGEFEGL